MTLPEDFQFTREFEVGSFQVHPDGEIRMCSLADLLQEIAWRHADSGDFGRNLLDNQQMWVLSRFEIKVSKFPRWGDKIRIFTGGRGAEKLFAFREFLVWDQHEKVLARAMSSWLLLHTQTKRIQKPESVLPPELFDPTKKPSWQPEKLSFMGNLIGEEEIKVQHSDLDLYHHVNNTSYIRWVENSLSEFGLKAQEISINYLSECHAGDRIVLSVSKLEEEIFVLGESNTKPVFLAKVQALKL
ncbi:acyl-[acyl-carrier-protein] thioesterase [Algoriphagus mannitolivorans]|uniref:acyl-[acyl-carrier-protein] thioesterase n=1 Tax=Algoriphagus mannitolivorans TaxID=226504 RepID=UPI0003FCBAFB|nr:acyl-ACP thioesterase domain-containing protein [Algoriphagus mannitolivorans]